MGFNPRKMEAGRKAKADAEVAAGRATGMPKCSGDWNERQARWMPLLFAPTPRWRSATVFLWVRCPAKRIGHTLRSFLVDFQTVEGRPSIDCKSSNPPPHGAVGLIVAYADSHGATVS